MAIRNFQLKTAAGSSGSTLIKGTVYRHRGAAELKGILAGTGITVTGGTNDVTIATSGVAAITSGTIAGATLSGNINSDIKRSSAATTVNGSTTYTNVTGLTGFTVVPGTYRFRLVLPCTVANGSHGIKVSFAYTTAVLSAMQAYAQATTASAIATSNTTTDTSNADLYTATAQPTQIVVDGTMVVSTGGTVDVQMAQNTSGASNTVILVGASAELTRIA